jgi:hypothetical protein
MFHKILPSVSWKNTKRSKEANLAYHGGFWDDEAMTKSRFYKQYIKSIMLLSQ